MSIQLFNRKCMKNQKSLFFVCVCLIYVLFSFSYFIQMERPFRHFNNSRGGEWISPDSVVATAAKPNPLNSRVFEDCKDFYLDIGSNIGVQIRKLFEPEHYPASPVISIFDNYFGNINSRLKNKGLCAVGFEMNPHHTKRLKELETKYNSCGKNVYLYTETAVAAFDGQIEFWSDDDINNNEWGASTIHKWKNTSSYRIHALNLGSFLKQNVIPFASTIVAKIDIEGQELNILPSLLAHGVLCDIDILMVEFHDGMINEFNDINDFKIIQNSLDLYLKRAMCNTTILDLDDETYHTDSEFEILQC